MINLKTERWPLVANTHVIWSLVKVCIIRKYTLLFVWFLIDVWLHNKANNYVKLLPISLSIQFHFLLFFAGSIDNIQTHRSVSATVVIAILKTIKSRKYYPEHKDIKYYILRLYCVHINDDIPMSTIVVYDLPRNVPKDISHSPECICFNAVSVQLFSQLLAFYFHQN